MPLGMENWIEWESVTKSVVHRQAGGRMVGAKIFLCSNHETGSRLLSFSLRESLAALLNFWSVCPNGSHIFSGNSYLNLKLVAALLAPGLRWESSLELFS